MPSFLSNSAVYSLTRFRFFASRNTAASTASYVLLPQDWRYWARRWLSPRPREYVPRRLLSIQPGNDSDVPDLPLGSRHRCSG